MAKLMKKNLVSFSILPFLLVHPAAAADETKLVCRAGPSQNAIVMLFTSDASSTCNPALEWMTAQKQKDPQAGPWQTFVPIAMHVAQWDTSAYKDTRAKKEFDQILNAYQKNWGAARTYAPTVAVNGVEWSGWSREQDVPRPVGQASGVLSVSRKEFEDTYTAQFEPDAKLEGPFTLHAALLSFGVTSRPAEGKNRGKTLLHDFIALLYQTKDLQPSRSVHTASVEIKVPRALHAERLAVAFWVTKTGLQVPLQAAGGYLER